MTQIDKDEINPGGEALVQELLWVHGIIRRNLETIQALIKQVVTGASAEHIRAQVDDLAARSIIWRLRDGCLRYCRFVHGHHHTEDAMFFPGLRRVNPALCPIIDKLEADHVVVAELLDKVEAAATLLLSEESARTELAAALNQLAEHLFTHLDYEEASLTPTLRTLNGWPMG